MQWLRSYAGWQRSIRSELPSRIRRQCSKRRRYGKPLTGILRLLDGKNARPSEHPFSAALIETRRKIARAAEQSVLTEVFGFPTPAAPALSRQNILRGRSPPTATFDPLESRVCEADIATPAGWPGFTPG